MATRDGSDFFWKINRYCGYRGYLAYPIFVGFKSEQDGSSINWTVGLTAVDQAGCRLQDGSRLQRVVGGLPIDFSDFQQRGTMNMSRSLSRMTAGFLPAVLLLLAACGGGGGGGGGGAPAAVVYSGNTSQAAVTTTNASKLTANAIGGDDAASIIVGVSAESSNASQDQGSGLVDVSRRLSRDFRDTVVNATRVRSAHQAAPALVLPDVPELCDGGNGTIRIFGTLNDVTLTGTLTVVFSNCLITGVTVNGQATMRIDAWDPGFTAITDSTMSFARLTLRATGLSLDAGGSMRDQLNIATRTETLTVDLVQLDNSTGLMTKTADLVIVSVYNNIFTPTSFTATVSGQVFDQVRGYVVITTPTMLAFGTLNQRFPDSGQLLLTGAGDSTIRVTAVNSTLVQLQLDTNGDSTVDNTARLKWTELSGPVGADLADTDSDGMHDSWETANGLNPNPGSNDAALDSDGDGFSNLAEYLGGSDPNNAAIIPSMLVGGVFPVASDVSVAISDTEIPGRSAIGSDGNNFLLVSCRQLGPSAGLFGVSISENGQVVGNFPISNENCPLRPAIAFDGTNYLVVISRNGQIFGTRVTPGGNVLDGGGGFPISTLNGSSNNSASVAFDGTNYLVVWVKFLSGSNRIYGARITPSGVVLDEFAISNGGFESEPVLTFGGGNYVVVWTDGSGGNGSENILGSRVSPTGAVLDLAGIAIAMLPGSQYSASVAFDGTNYLVVWDHLATTGVFPPPDGKIFGRRMTPTGTLLDGTASSDGIAISTGPFANHSSSVAFAGNTFVVTWAVSSFPNFPPAGIFAARVSKSGVRIDGLPSALGAPISGPPSTFSRFVHPVVAPKGQNALISWVDNIELSGTKKNILGVSLFVP